MSDNDEAIQHEADQLSWLEAKQREQREKIAEQAAEIERLNETIQVMGHMMATKDAEIKRLRADNEIYSSALGLRVETEERLRKRVRGLRMANKQKEIYLKWIQSFVYDKVKGRCAGYIAREASNELGELRERIRKLEAENALLQRVNEPINVSENTSCRTDD